MAYEAEIIMIVSHSKKSGTGKRAEPEGILKVVPKVNERILQCQQLVIRTGK